METDHNQLCAAVVEDTLRPLRRSVPEAVRVVASNTSDERDHKVVGTGSAVSPVSSSACLRKVGAKTDPTILPPFDGLKRFRLLSGLV
jgi:hypothetical protein